MNLFSCGYSFMLAIEAADYAVRNWIENATLPDFIWY